MRTSRLSKDTSKLISAMPHSEPASGLRRSTRSSLARFTYRERSSSATSIPRDSPSPASSSLSDLSFGSDIEDAVKSSASPPPSSARTTTRKRKRTTTLTAAPNPATKIKAERTTETTAALSCIPSPSKPAPRRRKPARTTTDAATGETTAEPPTDWEEVYALVKEMRLSGPAAGAAVDTMGCERLADGGASARDRRFHTLVALMLSSQTKDTVNAVAMRRLKEEMPAYKEGAPKGLNLENMLAVDPDVLNEMIWQVGFHNNKTKYLKQAAVILRDKFDGDIPPTIEGLTSLPGVGPKMAHLCMSAENGWNRVEGIGVDVHVHRITNLWGWNKTSTPEATRLALQAWLPRDRWKEINWLLVGFGQTVCLPVGRRCGECEVGLKGLCPAAERKKVLEGRKRREETVFKVVKEDEDGGAAEVVKKEIVEEKEDVVKDVVVNEEVPDEVKTEPETGNRRRR
ncbi:hypothetical protein NKR23_g961 [Pleurostoma richardsiae]|uniref:Endonuclease III homolog n=1 Tax=Pleurostoma richardsiae TaxID=41990 RepID=A0AA38VWA5_9PEZI|nr:hypothetical protein NKR23_g961 [Pleurostoma richardsiae]